MNTRTRILIVDDDDTVRRSYLRSLAGVGASCDVAATQDGASALRAMEEQPFDVVLLDLRMPGMDGLSVLKAIKERWPESQVVIITGYPTLETVKEAIQVGACDYLSKPVGPQEIIHAANGALTRRQWALQRVRTEH
jgi:two-component system response regulator AtoC